MDLLILNILLEYNYMTDIFNSLIEPRYRGTGAGNRALERYLAKLKTASDKDLIRDLDKHFGKKPQELVDELYFPVVPEDLEKGGII